MDNSYLLILSSLLVKRPAEYKGAIIAASDYKLSLVDVVSHDGDALSQAVDAYIIDNIGINNYKSNLNESNDPVTYPAGTYVARRSSKSDHGGLLPTRNERIDVFWIDEMPGWLQNSKVAILVGYFIAFPHQFTARIDTPRKKITSRPQRQHPSYDDLLAELRLFNMESLNKVSKA